MPLAPSRPPVDPDTERRFGLGERAAFLAVYDTHAPSLRAMVARFFKSEFEREEAAQEVWLLIHRMRGSFDPRRGELLPWLRTLAANRCKEILRARGRRPDAGLELDELTAPADTVTPEDQARATRAKAAIARFQAGLSEEEVAVFRLSILEERTHEETALATGTTARRCKYLRHKLLSRAAADVELRAALGELTTP